MRKEQLFIDQLPDEVLMHIFTHLELASIPNTAMVQQRWHRLFCDESFWTSLLLHDFSPFYSKSADIKTCAITPHALYQKEHKMKTIISCMVFGKKIPKEIMEDDSLWETLYQRIFPKPKKQVFRWRSEFYLGTGYTHNTSIKFNLLILSGYADILQNFIENIRNVPHQIKHTKKSTHKRSRRKLRSKLASQPRLSELVNQVCDNGYTPLLNAALKGHLDIAKLLLKCNANVNQTCDNGATPLYIAAQEGHLKITTLLLDHYANINQTCDDGATPLYIAAQEGHLKIAKFLLDRHANVNQACNNGETPLYIAAYKGHLDIVKLLIQHGADYNQIPASLIRKYPKVNTCYQKAQAELLKEQQSLSTQTTLSPNTVLNSANHPAINQPSFSNRETDETSNIRPN